MKSRKVSIFVVSTLLTIALTITGCSKAADSSGSSSPAAKEPQPTWTQIGGSKIEHKTNYMGFLNENFGITVGYAGEMHYSTDGGKTWPQGENKSLCRFSLDIVNENLAWSGGNGNMVRVTKDGGKTWQEVSNIGLTNKHTQISFIDDKTGWIGSTIKFASTADGGQTWNEMALPEDKMKIAAMDLRTANDGYLLKDDGTLFITCDAGKTWSSQNVGIDKLGLKSGTIVENSVPIAEVNFTDENNGSVILGGVTQDGYKVWSMETKDGGKTWSSEEVTLGEKFAPTSIFITRDGKFLTLFNGKEAKIYKHN